MLSRFVMIIMMMAVVMLSRFVMIIMMMTVVMLSRFVIDHYDDGGGDAV